MSGITMICASCGRPILGMAAYGRAAEPYHQECTRPPAQSADPRLSLFDQMRETLKHVLADLKSPFPKEAQAIARLRMGESSIEKAEAILAALKALEKGEGK